MQLSILLAVGLVLAWIGERIVENPTARYGLTGVGAMLLVVAVVVRFLRANTRDGRERIYCIFALLHIVTLLGFVFYFL